MTRNKLGRAAAAVAPAVLVLAVGATAAAAGPTTIRTFRTVTVTPVHVSAQPAAIADKFCVGQGYLEAGAQLFVGLDFKDGVTAAIFRQIACVPDMRRRFLPHADELTIPHRAITARRCGCDICHSRRADSAPYRRRRSGAQAGSSEPETIMKTLAATVFFAAILASACSLAVGSPPVRVFHDVAVKPAHAAAPLDAIAEKFCRDEGFAAAGAHLFAGFTGSDGSLMAHFRQIACRTYQVRKLEKSSAAA